jgi:hypothetical protein
MTSTFTRFPHDAALLSRDVDDLLLHIRGLVLVRDILEERGAGAGELRAYSEEAERLRGQLADLIRG